MVGPGRRAGCPVPAGERWRALTAAMSCANVCA
jgi:hypothetical protein